MTEVKRGILNINELQVHQAQEIADKFVEEWDAFCATGFTVDDELTAWLYRKYLEVMEVPNLPPKDAPFYRTSSTGSDKRSLALMARNAKEDKRSMQPHQARWVNIGTAVGDVVQMFVLLMEKHYERLLDKPCSFRFERVGNDYPHFEQFSTKYMQIESEGVRYAFGGSVDGILIYTNSKGKETRIGLEVKSKQTSAARTGLWSMKEPEYKHVEQVKAYSILHDLDQYIVLYVNCAHLSKWEYTLDDYAKTPDIRAFGIQIGEAEKQEVLDTFADATIAAKIGKLPKLDASKWTFNNLKRECSLSLSKDELDELYEDYSNMPKTKKAEKYRKDMKKMLDEIERYRKETK